jgi:hypothetical protein
MVRISALQAGHFGYICRSPEQGAITHRMDMKDFTHRSALLLRYTASKLMVSAKDLLPIVLVVTFFQAVVLRQPLPQVGDVIFGALLVVVGLMLFVEGLEMGLFPIGEALATALTRKGSLFWLLTFAFFLGFATTVAEPALIAVVDEAARVAVSEQLISDGPGYQRRYALGLRMVVALAVGSSILIGVIRILKGWPIYYFIMGGYGLVLLASVFAPKEIVGIAYDLGGVTTSTITTPLVTALGVGLAGSIKGRNPLTEGFGLIALASLVPIIFVLLYGMILFVT